jgi:alpha 1,2-mannosyltransferase
LILVAKDHSQDPQRQDGPYTEKDRASVEQWAPHSTITWHEINMYSGDALEPNVTVENILAWRKGKNGGIEGRSLGYQSMCRLWSGRLQNMPGILDDFDFYMRMDDDSLLVDKPEVDPFQHFQNDANLSYAYRRKMSDHWGIDELWRVARPYVMDPKISSSNEDMRHEFLQSVAAEYESNDSEDNNHNPVFTYTGQQPYNNFHVSRVNFWRLPSWQALMKDMDANHLFFKHRVGDANVHAMALMMMGDRKSEQWYHFPYAHNSNDMGMQWGTREWKTECEGPDH